MMATSGVVLARGIPAWWVSWCDWCGVLVLLTTLFIAVFDAFGQRGSCPWRRGLGGLSLMVIGSILTGSEQMVGVRVVGRSC